MININTKLIFILSLASTLSFADYATVTKVIDGDTVYFNMNGDEVKCRFAYVDTPESKKNEKAKKDASKCNGVTVDYMVEAGKEAAQYTKEYFKKGSKHNVKIVDMDRYGRAVCEIDNFNIELVEAGYAVPFVQYIPILKQREYKVAVQEAKKNRAGLWHSHNSVMQCMQKYQKD